MKWRKEKSEFLLAEFFSTLPACSFREFFHLNALVLQKYLASRGVNKPCRIAHHHALMHVPAGGNFAVILNDLAEHPDKMP